jgi:hypothetical protein
MYNLNSAERTTFDPVPSGIYKLRIKLLAGTAGPEGILQLAKNLRTEMLAVEYTILHSESGDREFEGRTFRDWITLAANLNNDDPDLGSIDAKTADGYRRAVKNGWGKLRDIIESHYALDHNDGSEEAQKKREFDTLQIFDGLEFWAQVDVRKGSNGYRDSNCIDRVLTPDMTYWPGDLLESSPPSSSSSSKPLPPMACGRSMRVCGWSGLAPRYSARIRAGSTRARAACSTRWSIATASVLASAMAGFRRSPPRPRAKARSMFRP